MKKYVILVAGGSGSRMKSDVPKQFLAVNGLPVLMHTIKAFRNYADSIEIILVLPVGQFAFWQELCSKYLFSEKYTLIAGGETRFHSVKNGLDSIETAEMALVAVHDGVRPVITEKLIKNGFEKAAEAGTAVVSVPLKDSLRIMEADGTNTAVERSVYRLIQTPQIFRIDWMRKAFQNEYQMQFTDCASVLEFEGYPIHLTEGAYENIKITTPEDLRWAELFLPQY